MTNCVKQEVPEKKKPIPKIRNGGVFKHEKKNFDLWAGKPVRYKTDLVKSEYVQLFYK